MVQLSWESLLIWLNVREPEHSGTKLTQTDIREQQRIRLELQLAREKQRAFMASRNQLML